MALPRRIALSLALLPLSAAPLLAQQAELPGKPPPADPNQRRYADSGRCSEGSAFDIVNLSAVPIQEVYLRQSGQTGGWGEDRLGSRVLRARDRISLDPGIGRFDILILRADGRAFTALRQNPCAISLVQLEADERISIQMMPLRPAALAAVLALSLTAPAQATDKPTGKPPMQDGVCTTEQRAMVSAAFDQAEARVRQAIALLEARPDHPHVQRWFGTTPGKVVRLHFELIAERLASGRRPQIRCNDREGCPANRRLFGYHPGRSDLIGLCRGFFEAGETGQDARFGVIIHEVSHLAVGTRDAGYQPRDAEALAKDDPVVAAMNADNYEYFAETLPEN